MKATLVIALAVSSVALAAGSSYGAGAQAPSAPYGQAAPQQQYPAGGSQNAGSVDYGSTGTTKPETTTPGYTAPGGSTANEVTTPKESYGTGAAAPSTNPPPAAYGGDKPTGESQPTGTDISYGGDEARGATAPSSGGAYDYGKPGSGGASPSTGNPATPAYGAGGEAAPAGSSCAEWEEVDEEDDYQATKAPEEPYAAGDAQPKAAEPAYGALKEQSSSALARAGAPAAGVVVTALLGAALMLA